MTRKSASKAKVIKNQNFNKVIKKPEFPPIEETFGNIKQIIINTAEVSIVVAGRIDNLLNVRAAAYKFWGNELDAKFTDFQRMDYFKQLQAETVACYENILETVKKFELDEFLKEDMKDYFEPLMPKSAEVETEEDLFRASLIADIVKPWGEKMSQFHHQMLDEQGQRKAIEEDL